MKKDIASVTKSKELGVMIKRYGEMQTEVTDLQHQFSIANLKLLNIDIDV